MASGVGPQDPGGTSERSPTCVYWSTTESVEYQVFSILAAVEVAAAVGLYAAMAVWLQTQTHLWVSIAVAPLLLLRSTESVALGVRMFEGYIDRSFGVWQLPEEVFRSTLFWTSVALALSTVALAGYGLGKVFLRGNGYIADVALGLLVGYLAPILGLATAVATTAKEVAMVARRRDAAAALAVALFVAAGLGVWLSGATIIAIITALLATMVLAAVGVLEAPGAVAVARERATAEAQGNVRGVTFARAALVTAPFSFVFFAPGFFFGAWLRSVATRIAATVRHLLLGLHALPQNYWRTLFVIDFRHPPDVVPGYKREDPFNPSFVFSRIRLSRNYWVYALASLILFTPAYLYRFCIKSTCWFWYSLVYMAYPSHLSNTPTLLGDLLWQDPREWGRRLFAISTVIGLLVTNLWSAENIKGRLPPVLISPLEYLFLIDVRAVRPWQWFAIVSAASTLYILAHISEFRIRLRHAGTSPTLGPAIAQQAVVFERAMRLRTISTWFFILIAFMHAMLALSPLQRYLPDYVLYLLRAFYGDAMP